MPKFKFVALDPNGKTVSGNVESESEREATQLIEGKGYSVSTMEPLSGNGSPGTAKPARKPARRPPPARATAAGPKGKKASKSKAVKGLGGRKRAKKQVTKPSVFNRVKTKELMTLTRQLATLVNAGLPLVRGLEVLRRQEKNPLLNYALGDMGESISAGSTFAEAMIQHPKIFDKLYVNMVKAGELGGVLDTVLSALAEFMEKMQKIKNKVISAMVYPVVVLVMAMGILTFLMVFIIPKFEAIFDDILEGQSLPLLTRVVMWCSSNMVTGLPWIILTLGGIVALVTYAKSTERGRLVLDTIKLKTPLFGSLIQKTAIARFSRTLSTLMNSGVPVLQALTIVGETSGNAVISQGVASIHDAVKEGESMAPPIDATGLFPPMVVSMVEVGEETGDLPQMLARIAETYDDEVDNAVSALTSIIEPIMIIFLAVIVGSIVIALFLPLIQIISGLS
jgi:type IV pilus assembly protein PilC